jgi:hypothetical protein
VYQDDVVRLFWDTRSRYHVALWRGVAVGETLRTAAHACLSASRERPSRSWLADITDFAVLDPDDEKWITDEFYPLLARNGVRRVAYVLPVEAVTALSLRRMNTTYGEKGSILFDYCCTRAEAVRALASCGAESLARSGQ